MSPSNRYYIEAGGWWHPVDEYDYSTPPDGYADQQWQELEERLNIYARSAYPRLQHKPTQGGIRMNKSTHTHSVTPQDTLTEAQLDRVRDMVFKALRDSLEVSHTAADILADDVRYRLRKEAAL